MQVRYWVVDVDLNGIPADSDVNNRSCRKERDRDFERHIAPRMVDDFQTQLQYSVFILRI